MLKKDFTSEILALLEGYKYALNAKIDDLRSNENNDPVFKYTPDSDVLVNLEEELERLETGLLANNIN